MGSVISPLKKLATRPAGDQNCSQSDGRIFFFFHIFSLLENIVHVLEKKLFFMKNEKKRLQSHLFLVTWPLNRKHNYFYGQLKNHNLITLVFSIGHAVTM